MTPLSSVDGIMMVVRKCKAVETLDSPIVEYYNAIEPGRDDKTPQLYTSTQYRKHSQGNKLCDTDGVRDWYLLSDTTS